MSEYVSAEADEIDLGELFRTLWAYKIFIAVISGIFLVGAGYYALTADKEYTTKAVFLAPTEKQGGLSLGGELGGLAALAGLSAGSNSSLGAVLERVQSREFILAAADKLDFASDPDFNDYDPDAVDPLWKATLKNLIGWVSAEDVDAIVERNVLENYRELIQVSETDGGALEVSVTNTYPARAADYANALMDMITQMMEREQKAETDERLAYLSDTLATSLVDVERTQEALAEFSMENGVTPEQSLISESSDLERYRREREATEEFLLVVDALTHAITSGETSPEAFEDLRAAHPAVDDVRFRRILGLSETVNSWSWPTAPALQLVDATLNNRLTRLNVEISALSERAEVTARRVEELADLKRQATIAEATYRVMIEQVKAQTLSAGYQPDNFKVYQYATAPVTPSAPKRNLILALGLVLGVFSGSAMALVLGMRRGVHYGLNGLLAQTNAGMSLKMQKIRRLCRLPLNLISERLSARALNDLDEATIELSGDPLLLVCGLNARASSAGIGRVLAAAAAHSNKRVLLCDTTWSSDLDTVADGAADYTVSRSIDGVDVVRMASASQKRNIYTRTDFAPAIQKFMSDYDQVIVAGRDELAVSAAKSLRSLKPALVLAARLGKTKKSDIQKILDVTGARVLIHD